MESPLLRLEALQKKYTELLADMKRLDRENFKSKKRADQLQKEKDQGRSELSKTVSMKEKLEKLCRELTRENKKMKVGLSVLLSGCVGKVAELIGDRMSIKNSRTARKKVAKFWAPRWKALCGILKIIRNGKRIQRV
jgi:predicted RNase H-like nuclease (RuvC/YqgF family)